MNTGHLQRNHPYLSPALITDRTAYSLPVHVSSRFGVRLRTLLEERPLAHQRIAACFGVDRNLMEDLAQGRRSLSMPMLETLALSLDFSLPELLSHL